MPDTPVTRVSVDAAALRSVLVALNGHPHQIRELQFTRDIDDLVGERNPINVLLDDFNAAADATNAEPATTEQSSAVARSGAVPAVTDEMVSRFLGWRLPENFSPDGGVRIDDNWRQKFPMHWPPTGTNLLNIDQARAMLEHVLAAAPEPPQGEDLSRRSADWLNGWKAGCAHIASLADTPRSGDAPVVRQYNLGGAKWWEDCESDADWEYLKQRPGTQVRVLYTAPPADARDAGKLYALLSPQGTACHETVLSAAEFTPQERSRVEQSIRPGTDAAVPGTWTDVSDNDAFAAACHRCESLAQMHLSNGIGSLVLMRRCSDGNPAQFERVADPLTAIDRAMGGE